MKPLIIDTSAFISLGSVADSNYTKAQQISKEIQQNDISIIVSGEIFAETINIIGKKVNHQAAIKQAEAILTSNNLTIAEITPVIRNNALKIFKKQPASVSFTDCLVMAFADEYETKHIFGFDETFRKNGYLRIGID